MYFIFCINSYLDVWWHLPAATTGWWKLRKVGVNDDVDNFLSWRRRQTSSSLCHVWTYDLLTLSSPGSSAGSKNQIFTAACLPSKHPFLYDIFVQLGSVSQIQKELCSSRPSREHFPPTTVKAFIQNRRREALDALMTFIKCSQWNLLTGEEIINTAFAWFKVLIRRLEWVFFGSGPSVVQRAHCRSCKGTTTREVFSNLQAYFSFIEHSPFASVKSGRVGSPHKAASYQIAVKIFVHFQDVIFTVFFFKCQQIN